MDPKFHSRFWWLQYGTPWTPRCPILWPKGRIFWSHVVCRVVVSFERAEVDVSVHRLHMNSRYEDFGPLTIRFVMAKEGGGRTYLVFRGRICRLLARGRGAAGRRQRREKIDPAVSFKRPGARGRARPVHRSCILPLRSPFDCRNMKSKESSSTCLQS